ncbi:MAG: hypothetical protein AB1564_15525 [Chloroflexota bacterium]
MLIPFLLTACSGFSLNPPVVTATPRPPTPTPFLSPTIVWFPPTSTPTSRASASQTSTPDLRPGLGEVIATDDFTDESLWDTFESDAGVITVGRERITLAAQPNVYLVSLDRELVLGDFYAEITASPSLCRGADEYGFLVRAIPVTYYRVALTCDGQIHMERVSGNERHVLQSPVLSGDAPRGAPGQTRIGVWAAGRELRVFLNGRHQFSVTDANLSSGTLGVFVRAAGGTPVTVTFSDLVVQDVDYIPPTRTPSP